MRDRYPSTNTNVLHTAITDLWIDRLSYSTGKTTIARFDMDAIYHRISCLAGASGGPILDVNGNLIGSHISNELSNLLGLHSRGEYVPHPTDANKWIVDTSCNNIAAALDGTYILPFLKHVVAPLLSGEVQNRWLHL